MKDLSYTYMTSSHTFITREYDTLMDFMEDFERNTSVVIVSNQSDIEATFFENPRNTKKFKTIKDLYDHCVSITK